MSAPDEKLPDGWVWWADRNTDYFPLHTWSDMCVENAGEAWWMEAHGKMGPHGDSSKVNLAPMQNQVGK